MSHHAVLSDTTSVTSPDPFSPFSSAFSVSSEATVVSDGQADLGAFQSVFFALSQLHRSHPSHSSARSDSNNSNDPVDDFTRSSTPNVHPVSPFSLGGFSSHPPSRITRRSQSSNDTQPGVNPVPEIVEPTPDGESDIVVAGASSSSAAEDGDEESLALTSPKSHPSSDSVSIADLGIQEELDSNGSRLWTYAEISPDRASLRASGSSESDDLRQAEETLDVDDDKETPSLGSLESAFAFFAAERAKLAKQLEQTKSGTPPSNTGGLPKKKNGKRGPKGSKKGGRLPSSSSANVTTIPTESDEELDSALKTAEAAGKPSSLPQPNGPSSSEFDDVFGARKKQQRGILPRPSKQTLKQNKTTNAASTPASLNTSNRRRPGNHRHSRSLPIDSRTIRSLQQNASSIPGEEVTRIQSLARRLTFQFPTDGPSLRRVIDNPETALNLGSFATLPEDALVAEGFFDPADTLAAGRKAAGSSRGANVQSALLHVFIDHSNILVGFLEWLKKQNNQGLATPKRGSKPKLSHAALVLLLERGRKSVRKVLVASSPLWQSLDEVASMGYQISVLQRVEIKEGAFGSNKGHHRSSSSGVSIPASQSTSTLGGSTPAGTPSRPKNGNGRAKVRTPPANDNSTVISNNNSSNGNTGSSTESEDVVKAQDSTPPPATKTRAGRGRQYQHRRTASEQVSITPSNSTTSMQTINGASPAATSTPSTRPRFREEAVDELLQLKLLQTLLDTPSPLPTGSTIVLASGDAARSQFNPEGFLGCVRKALKRGWNVEVVGWEEGRSRAYGELLNEIERGELGTDVGTLTLIGLDRWGLDLIEREAQA